MKYPDLTTKDGRTFDALARNMLQTRHWAECMPVVANGMSALVDADFYFCSEADPLGSHFTRSCVIGHDEHRIAALSPAFCGHLDNNPILANLGFAGVLGGPAIQYTDFVTLRQFRHLGTYCDYYHKLNVNRSLTVGLGVFGGVPVLACANRSGRIYSERERQLFTALKETVAPILKQKADDEIARKRLARLFAIIRETSGCSGIGEITLSELTVAKHILRGKSYPQTALALGRSPRTIEKHAASLLGHLGLEHRTQLPAFFMDLAKQLRNVRESAPEQQSHRKP
jgi:DNA-binding CsgD family transcriptional regulator